MLARVMAVDYCRGLPDRPVGYAAGHDPDLCLVLINPERNRLLRPRQQRERFRIIRIDHRDRAASEKITEQLAQFLHALVIEADVEQHPNRGPIQRYRVVAFIR